jgi:hypothetical protein
MTGWNGSLAQAQIFEAGFAVLMTDHFVMVSLIAQAGKMKTRINASFIKL